jgi:phosphatidylethanolamine/phosphatidyl-N-methylethanolamine N-methyltransferase
MRLRSSRVFIESAARDFKRTGAIAPSSRPLALAMTRAMAPRRDRIPISVLEVGGGIGNITQEIARHLRHGDHLDVYEIDPQLAGILKERVESEACFSKCGAKIQIHQKGIEKIAARPLYDFVISCLPFTNFQPQAVRKIFELYRIVLKPGGICSFYEYILVRNAARLMTSRSSRERCAGVASVVRQTLEETCYKKEVVFRNLPPATVYFLRFQE